MFQSEHNLILVHPGSTELDDQGRLSGSLNLPLSESGEAEVRLMADELFDIAIDLIISSPGIAAQQTSQAISRDGEIKVRTDENLANLDLGLWHGKSIDELRETQPRLFRQWREQPETVTPPEGESVESARGRLRRANKRILRKLKSCNIAVVVSHPLAALLQSEFSEKTLSEFWDRPVACATWQVFNPHVSSVS